MDAAHFGRVVSLVYPDFGLSLLKLDVAGGIGLYLAADDFGFVAHGIVRKAAQGTDIECQGLAGRYLVNDLSVLENFSAQHYGRLSHLGTDPDGLHVFVRDVASNLVNDRIQSQSLRHDGRFHVLPENLVFPFYLPPVQAYTQTVGIVLQGALLRNSEGRCEGFVRDVAAVGAELVDGRNVAAKEVFQLPVVHKVKRIGGDGFQESAVLFVSF